MKVRAYGDGLVRHSLLLLVAQQVGNVSTMGFQIVMGWTLTPPEYAVLAAMLGVVLIIGTPMVAIQTALAHFSARLAQDNLRAGIRLLLRRWYGYMTWVALFVLVVGLGLRPYWVRFFHLESSTPIILTTLTLAASLYPPILLGTLNGLQAFIWLSITGHSWAVMRLVLGATLVWFVVPTASAGLLAQFLAVGICLGIGLYAVRCLLGSEPAAGPLMKGVRTYAIRSFLIIAGYAVLMNADIVLVRRFLPGEIEFYARARAIALAVVFFPTPIIAAMFPKVTSAGATTWANWWTLLRAVFMVMGAIGCMVAGGLIFPEIPLFILFNERAPDPELVRLVRGVLLALSPLGLVCLLMNFELAQHRFGSTLPLILCAAGFLVGAILLHRSAWDIVYLLGAANALCAILLVAGLPWRTLPRSGPP